jgi:hypothetical protein
MNKQKKTKNKQYIHYMHMTASIQQLRPITLREDIFDSRNKSKNRKEKKKNRPKEGKAFTECGREFQSTPL